MRERHSFSVPEGKLASDDDVASVAALLRKGREEGGNGGVAVLTGAGISTESGIPDYRSVGGLYERGEKPITFHEFVTKEERRKLFWLRSLRGLNSEIHLNFQKYT